MHSERNQYVIICLTDIVPKNHFPRKLLESFPWDNLAEPFKKCFKGEKEYGPNGYPTATFL